MDYREPLEVAAGDTITWTRNLSDYIASDGWALAYALRGPAVVDIVATSDGDAHLVTINPSDLTVSGTYCIQGYATKGEERRTVYSGRLLVRPDLVTAGADYDGRTHAQRVIDAIEAVIEGRATRDQQEITIDGDRLVKIPFTDLLSIRNKYRQEVAAEAAREKRKQGRGSGRTVKFVL